MIWLKETAISSAVSANSAKTSISAEMRSFRKLLRQANTVIKNIAQREKYDLILQEAIYVNPKI